jgi:hypothetical protein
MTNHDKYECARRELAMRQRVYPKWVESGRMSQATADHEIACMKAIVEDYKEKAEPSLFGEE